MKKNFLTIATVVIFAIGFGASAENKDSNKERQRESQQTVQTQESEAEKNARNAFVGDYVYRYYYGNTEMEVFFKISLKSDGTFTHEPNNEQTKQIVDVATVVDGKDYPSSGEWKVKDTSEGKAAILDFDGNWGEGSITPDKSMIQINNMNGLRLKAPLTRCRS